MFISFIPQPSLFFLVHALSIPPQSGKYWQICYPDHSIQFYASGSFALADAVKIILDSRKKNSGIVWVPDYFCNEALAHIRSIDIRFHFYPIKENLEPDWDEVEYEIDRIGSPDIFIIVHYFGFPNDTDKAIQLSKQYHFELVEDMAHLLSGNKSSNLSYKIFSPRKLLPIPEGGILVSPNNHAIPSVNIRTGNNNILKWILMKFVQKILIGAEISWYRFHNLKTDTISKKSYQNDYTATISLPHNYSLKLLSLFEGDMLTIIEKRRTNYALLHNRVKRRNNIRPLFPCLMPGACPYVFPIVIEENKKTFQNKLFLKGIPTGTWPDLPPEVENDEEHHKNAVWFHDHVLLIPIHQDLGEKQIHYIADILVNL